MKPPADHPEHKMEALLAAYSLATSTLGFGLQLDRALLGAGLTWGQIHALTDAGLVKPVAVFGNNVQYRLHFP